MGLKRKLTRGSYRFLQQLAKMYHMVIVSPILERDEDHQVTIEPGSIVVFSSLKYTFLLPLP